MDVTAAYLHSYDATSMAHWVHLTSGISCEGDVTITMTFTVDANTGVEARTDGIIIEKRLFQIHQSSRYRCMAPLLNLQLDD